jgi:PHD/YefM family antitoxin component YafN of YafNO toxin-antitoxin module
MLIPQTNYVIDNNGQKVFVQIAVQDWENLMKEIQQLENLLKFKAQLKNAFREVRQIKQGKKFGTPLSTLINEL